MGSSAVLSDTQMKDGSVIGSNLNLKPLQLAENNMGAVRISALNTPGQQLK
jgi:hypothetical protein